MERCLQILGQQPQPVTCYVAQAIERSHETFHSQNLPEQMLELFHLGAEYKTEHFEIAAYQGLIEKARLMGQQEIVKLLEENLRQEEEMARRLHQIARTLGQQMLSPQGVPAQAAA